MMANAARMGAALRGRLERLKARFEIIGDVRGAGLLLAFEIVADRATMTPFPREMQIHDRLVELAYERGLILYSRRTRGGYRGDHFLVAPPMIVTEAHLEEIETGLTRALEALEAEIAPHHRPLAARRA